MLCLHQLLVSELRVNSVYIGVVQKNMIFYDRTEVRTWTEPAEPEPWGSGQVPDFPGPNLEVRVRVLARMPRTRTGPDRGQSNW